MHGIFNSRLFLFKLSLSGGTDFNQGNSSYQFGQSFLKLLLIIIRSCVFNLSPDLFDAGLDIFLFSSTLNNRSVIFVNNHFFSITQPISTDIFKFHTDIFSNNFSST